jgi:hypothetical protein
VRRGLAGAWPALRLVGAILAIGWPTALLAQHGAGIQVTLPAAALRGLAPPLVQSHGVLSDRRVRDLLINGFPARLHYRLELWSRAGLFNSMESQIEWDVVVRYSPLDRRYTVARVEDGDHVTTLGTYEQMRGVEEAVAAPYLPPIRLPRERAHYYYNAVLEVEMISVSDLDEVERWLRGELRPAVRGEHSAGTALARGLRTLMVKLVGGEQRHYEARSSTFAAVQPAGR